MKRLLQRLRTETSGTTAVEYALIGALIAVIMVTAIGPVTEGLTSAFESVATAFPQP